MQDVTVVFTNGNIVLFEAEDFPATLENSSPAVFAKIPYKDGAGQDSFIHLRPRDVAGIFLTRSNSSTQTIVYTVAGAQK